MGRPFFFLIILVFILFSCSDDGSSDFEEKIIGGWQLDNIRVEGADCKLLFGEDVPQMYLADADGCASPDEILGNASRCINLEFMADGQGLFLWSIISGQQDAQITYTINNDEIRYCFVGSSCSDFFRLVGDKLENEVELSLDQDCKAIFVLRSK